MVYCARAKTFISGELNNVDGEGVRVAVKALQDYNNTLATRRAGTSNKTKLMLTNFVKFKSVYDDWTIDETRLVDPADGKWQAAAEVAQRVDFGPMEEEDGSESKFPLFSGYVFSRTGIAQISSALDDLGSLDMRGDVSLVRHEGVLLRLKGDGKRYSVSLREPGVDGRTFIAPFATTGRWQIVRVPFSQFRPEVYNRVFNAGDGEADMGPPMRLDNIERIGIRFEARNQTAKAAAAVAGQPAWMSELDSPGNNSFNLQLEYAKLLPMGDETDFVLVSCGGAGMEEGEDKDRVVKAKREGRAAASQQRARVHHRSPRGRCSRSRGGTRRWCSTRAIASRSRYRARTSRTCASRRFTRRRRGISRSTCVTSTAPRRGRSPSTNAWPTCRTGATTTSLPRWSVLEKNT